MKWQKDKNTIIVTRNQTAEMVTNASVKDSTLETVQLSKLELCAHTVQSLYNDMGNRTECTLDRFADNRGLPSLLLGEPASGILGPVKGRHWFTGVSPEEATELVRGRHTRCTRRG